MPLFFFLSGLFFYNSFSKNGGVKLISSKIDKIVYPYIIWSIMQGLTEVYLSNYTNGNITYPDVFSLLWSPRAQFWFLYALFVVFCMATIAFSVLPKKIAIATFVLSIIVYLYPWLIPGNLLVLHFISNYFVYFSFGVVFSLYFRVEQLSHILAVCLLACVFVLCQFMFHYTFGLNYANKGLPALLLALISIIFVVSLSSYASSKPNKLFVFIGTSSMAIYLMHIFASSGMRIVLKTFVGIDSVPFHLVAGCIFGVFFPILILTIINKLKIPYIFSAPISNWGKLLYNK